ncbi:MAG: type II secretion system protein GspE, partial [Gammaproteobacteria bacterium]|nr:type II secretion system protein GspE [Gammaproteobacteria bacterium]
MAAEPQLQTEPEAPEDVIEHSPRYSDFAAALVSRGKMRESEVIRAHRLALQTDDPRIPALLV